MAQTGEEVNIAFHGTFTSCSTEFQDHKVKVRKNKKAVKAPLRFFFIFNLFPHKIVINTFNCVHVLTKCIMASCLAATVDFPENSKLIHNYYSFGEG